MKSKGKAGSPPGEPVAGNGILSRRIFLEGALAAGAADRGRIRRRGAAARHRAVDENPGCGI